MKLPDWIKRHRIGGEIYRCNKCGLLVEVKDKTKVTLGFEIDGEIYGISSVNADKGRLKPALVDASTFPTHHDCIAMLTHDKIRQKGERWD